MRGDDLQEFIDDEEDVVLEGSELHAALTKMGFNDFECVPVHRIKYSNTDQLYHDINTELSCLKYGSAIKRIYHKILDFLIQDKHHSDEQLRVILQSNCLLDDHKFKIQSYIQGKRECISQKASLWLPFCFSSITIAMCGFNRTFKNILSASVALAYLILIVPRRFSQLSSNKNLNYLIFSQSQFYKSCKRSLKILRYSFRMKLDSGKPGSKFLELEKSKQMYLQPLTEILLSSLEKISFMYHKGSNNILKFLPSSIEIVELKTLFETEFFFVKGEITYQILKNLYYTFLLLQSETLHILAVVYAQQTWKDDSAHLEVKLLRIMNNLVVILDEQNSKIVKILDGYSSMKFVPEHREIRSYKTTKWQDLYVNLDLIAYKLQISHKVLQTTLDEIDSHVDDNLSDDVYETIAQNLNEVYKQLETAKCFTEFSSLLVAKFQHEQSNDKVHPSSGELIPEKTETRTTVIVDSEPDILDEVFEEYIKEEYMKPINEVDDDDSLIQDSKYDRLLAKNFMSELRDALIEKKKLMSERELKALQRMYGNVTQGVPKQECESRNDTKVSSDPPLPPALPSHGLTVSLQKITSPLKNRKVNPDHETGTQNSKQLLKSDFLEDSNRGNVDNMEIQRFFIPQCKFNQNFSSTLKISEETFIGSGENSEEEFIGSEPELDGK